MGFHDLIWLICSADACNTAYKAAEIRARYTLEDLQKYYNGGSDE